MIGRNERLTDVSITSEVLLEAGKVRHARVEALKGGVSAVDHVVRELKCEIQHLVHDEVSDAGDLAVTEEVLATKVVDERLQVVHEICDSNRLVGLLKDESQGCHKRFVNNELNSVVVSTLLRGLSEDLRAPLGCDELMDSDGLGDLQVVTEEVRD